MEELNEEEMKGTVGGACTIGIVPYIISRTGNEYRNIRFPNLLELKIKCMEVCIHDVSRSRYISIKQTDLKPFEKREVCDSEGKKAFVCAVKKGNIRVRRMHSGYLITHFNFTYTYKYGHDLPEITMTYRLMW